ncbi:arabinogalactan oligomer / maltooligosaccharide transport system permease protein [Caloramator quimbayensis]|uniref:Arabinogalactan oligomer / maltooligosaccharide transport system permease protein n=1 Tax=Caloramator quimbayensis TaxID=1147123 RepID=A0A1T4XMG4_9CLOT|nr:sugar ABC transporter permease [Caloramator quimbayensis]SKA90603.1 arabinogalactan oligomer / maltooligosaccharide transport system permease protein [Caloramator quimbayensis]
MELKTLQNKKQNRTGHSRNMAQTRWTPFFFLLPSLIVLCFIVLYPLFYEFWISFRNVTLLNLKSGKYPYIGFQNYIQILTDPLFYKTLLRTLVWTAINVFFHITFGLFLAILLNRKLPGKSIIRVLLILPWAIPQYIGAITWRGMFNIEYGAINILLTKFFGPNAAIPWLSDPKWSFIAAIITNIWLGIPFMMMTCLGGLQSIPQEFYEAADTDGASGWQKFKNITLPLLKPVITPAAVLGTVWTFNMISVIYVITYGAETEEAQILVSLVYKKAFSYFRYGYSAALSVIIFLILMSFSSIFIKSQKLED